MEETKTREWVYQIMLDIIDDYNGENSDAKTSNFDGQTLAIDVLVQTIKAVAAETQKKVFSWSIDDLDQTERQQRAIVRTNV